MDPYEYIQLVLHHRGVTLDSGTSQYYHWYKLFLVLCTALHATMGSGHSVSGLFHDWHSANKPNPLVGNKQRSIRRTHYLLFSSEVNTVQECHCRENSPAPESAAQYRWSWVSPALPALCSLGNAMDTSEILMALLGITVHWPFQAISWPHLATLTFQCICPVSITKNYMTVADWR
jgi:hypothetical protein